MLRINSGKLRGKKLKTLPGDNTRPTLEKTRGVIFDTLRGRYHLKNYSVIDLFAGSGALGIEAISNGSSRAIFLENDTKCFRILRNNIESCQIEEECTLIQRNAQTWLKTHPWSDDLYLFLIDPPYNTNLLQDVIDLIDQQNKQLHGSLLIIERDRHHSIEFPNHFDLFKRKKLSHTTLDFLEIS